MVTLPEMLGWLMLASLMGIGGGNGFIPAIQSQWVSAGYLDPAFFAWTIALGQLTPGPKVGFVAGVGYVLRGLPGAAVAVIATVIPTAVSCTALSLGMNRFRPLIRRIGVPGAFVVAGMIAATGWRMAAPTAPGLPEVAAITAVTYLIGWRDLDPVWVAGGSVATGLVWALFL